MEFMEHNFLMLEGRDGQLATRGPHAARILAQWGLHKLEIIYFYRNFDQENRISS